MKTMEENKMNIDAIIPIVECVATIASLIIAVIALTQSYRQTKLSNKQNLFNERVKLYLLIKGLIQLYNDNKGIIEEEKKDGIYFECDFVLGCLINNSYLEIMGNVINKPLHQEEQKEFLRKIEELKNEAEKTKFVFDKSVSKYLFEFIKSYEELLMQLYKYIVLIDSMRKIQEQIPTKNDIKEVAEEVNEKDHREKLIDKFKYLTEAFNNLSKYKIMDKVEKQIKL